MKIYLSVGVLNDRNETLGFHAREHPPIKAKKKSKTVNNKTMEKTEDREMQNYQNIECSH